MATFTSEWARVCAISKDELNDPFPTLTSRTSVFNPDAIFFDKIDEVIRGRDSTVPTVSRMEYNFLSAGAKFEVWPMIAHPTSSTTCRNTSISGLVF